MMLKLFLRINTVSGYLAAFLMWVLAVIVLINVALRVFGVSILWVNEISIYLLIGVVFTGIGNTLDRDGHFAIMHAVEALPRKVRLCISLCTTAIAFAFSVLFALGGISLVNFARSLSLESPTTVHMPLAIPYSIMVVGGTLAAMSLIVRIVSIIRELAGDDGTALDLEKTS